MDDAKKKKIREIVEVLIKLDTISLNMIQAGSVLLEGRQNMDKDEKKSA